jgi:hypothetical protein
MVLIWTMDLIFDGFLDPVRPGQYDHHQIGHPPLTLARALAGRP